MKASSYEGVHETMAQSKVVSLDKARTKVLKAAKFANTYGLSGGFSFSEEVLKDKQKLAETCGITIEEAEKMAISFYRKYPALMEFVRDPNTLLRNR